MLNDYSFYYNYFLKNNFPTLIAAGEYDMLDGAKGQEIWMKQLLKLDDQFWE